MERSRANELLTENPGLAVVQELLIVQSPVDWTLSKDFGAETSSEPAAVPAVVSQCNISVALTEA